MTYIFMVVPYLAVFIFLNMCWLYEFHAQTQLFEHELLKIQFRSLDFDVPLYFPQNKISWELTHAYTERDVKQINWLT